VNGITVGVNICEDIWLPEGPTRTQTRAGKANSGNTTASLLALRPSLIPRQMSRAFPSKSPRVGFICTMAIRNVRIKKKTPSVCVRLRTPLSRSVINTSYPGDSIVSLSPVFPVCNNVSVPLSRNSQSRVTESNSLKGSKSRSGKESKSQRVPRS